jgi:hypothetical protein
LLFKVKASGILITTDLWETRQVNKKHSHTYRTLTKVKLSLCSTQHHAMEACRGSGGIVPSILNLGTRSKHLIISLRILRAD